MSVSSEITRIQNARNTLRTKAVALGIGTSSDDIEDLATAYNNLSVQTYYTGSSIPSSSLGSNGDLFFKE